MRIVVYGQGYVGLVSAACLADWGNDVVGVEKQSGRVEMLRDGRTPFFEPGLDDIVTENLAAGRLRFSESVDQELEAADIVMIAVGTHDGHGGWQTQTILSCLYEVVPRMSAAATLVVRSTLPPSFVRNLSRLVADVRAQSSSPMIPVLINPEFTREGRAVHDFRSPDRIVLGVAHDPFERGLAQLRALYEPTHSPVVELAAIDASLSKLGANLFLATKISFANELAALCDLWGGDVDEVVAGMAHDARIGGQFLRAGIGFGGSCLPHQVSMTVQAACEAGVETPLLAATEQVNRHQRDVFVKHLVELSGGDVRGHRIALLGLTFKPNTDDLREAPSLTIADSLIRLGADVVAYDPMDRARYAATQIVPGLQVAPTLREALSGADAVGLITEWREFVQFDWSQAVDLMRGSVVVDGRNALDSRRLTAAGFTTRSFGRRIEPKTQEEPIVTPEQHAFSVGAASPSLAAGAVYARDTALEWEGTE